MIAMSSPVPDSDVARIRRYAAAGRRCRLRCGARRPRPAAGRPLASLVGVRGDGALTDDNTLAVHERGEQPDLPRTEQLKERLIAQAWLDGSLVFATRLGTPVEPRNLNRSWDALCDGAGVRRLRLHDLRHPAASFMLLSGTPMKVVQETLRHSRLSTTSDLYTHLLDELRREAAERMDQFLRNLGTP